MVFGGTLLLGEAESLLEKIRGILLGLGLRGEEIVVCGDYRLGKKILDGLDIVIFPTSVIVESSFFNKFIDKLKEDVGDVRISRVNNQECCFVIDSFSVCIYRGISDLRGSYVLFYTGPDEFLKALQKVAKDDGYHLNQFGLFDISDGLHRSFETEEEVFEELGLSYISPEDRVDVDEISIYDYREEGEKSLKYNVPDYIFKVLPEDVKKKLENFRLPEMDFQGIRIPRDFLWNPRSRKRYYDSFALWKKSHPDEWGEAFTVPVDLELDRYLSLEDRYMGESKGVGVDFIHSPLEAHLVYLLERSLGLYDKQDIGKALIEWVSFGVKDRFVDISESESAFVGQVVDFLFEKSKDTEKIKVENPGLLSLPKGKKFYNVPLSHYINLAKRIGKGKVMRGLCNIERWNRKKNPELSRKAREIIDRLKDNPKWEEI